MINTSTNHTKRARLLLNFHSCTDFTENESRTHQKSTSMADNWEDVAEYLLRNRTIREMVDDVLNSLDEIGPDCPFTTGKPVFIFLFSPSVTIIY
jgi:hypothetical protein